MLIKPTGEAAEALRELMPSLFAGVVVVAGLWMVYDLIIRGLVSSDAGLAILSGVIGAAVASIFQRNAIAQTAQAVTNGAATAAVARAAERAGRGDGTNG